DRPGAACFAKTFCQCAPAHDFVAGLLACDKVEGGYWWGLGSAYVRVLGHSGGACIYEIQSEVEGGGVTSRCTAPLPVHPWAGLVLTESDTHVITGDITDGLACTAISSCGLASCDGGPGIGCPPGAGVDCP